MHNLKLIVFSALSLVVAALLTSCAADAGKRGAASQLPNSGNNFIGIFSTEAIGVPASFTPQARQMCVSLGGLAEGPIYIDESLFTRYFKYRCHGIPINSEVRVVPIQPQPSAQNDEFKKLQAEVLRLQEIEKQRQVQIQVENSNKKSDAARLSLELAIKKCTDLGFRPATEGHGKCVLQMSR
jgi:hypothetical protein